MKLSVCIPVLNQSEKLLHNLRQIVLPYFDGLGLPYEVFICSDHSSLEEQEILDKAASSFPLHVHFLPYENHAGKGVAVKRMFLLAEGDYLLFMDADLATDLSIMEKIVPELGKYDAYIASRNAKGAKYVRRQPLIRRLTHFGARQIIRAKLHLWEIKDFQCGFKLFPKAIAKALAKHQIIDKGAFDSEYCYFLHLNGYKILELPCLWKDDPDSSIKHLGKASSSFYRDLKRIKKNKKSYLLSEEEKEAIAHAH